MRSARLDERFVEARGVLDRMVQLPAELAERSSRAPSPHLRHSRRRQSSRASTRTHRSRDRCRRAARGRRARSAPRRRRHRGASSRRRSARCRRAASPASADRDDACAIARCRPDRSARHQAGSRCTPPRCRPWPSGGGRAGHARAPAAAGSRRNDRGTPRRRGR